MWFFQNKRKGASITRGRRLTFDKLEDRNLLSITYPVDPSAVYVDGGTLTANYIPVDNLTIGSDATVNLTQLPDNPTEDISIKNATNNGSLNITGGDKTIGTISGTGNTTVSDGTTLTATSITQNTLTIGAGATLTIAAIPGGPESTSTSTTGSTPASSDMSATMDGGTLTYNSDALPNLSTVNDPVLVCTDPPDTVNAWRSTTTTTGGDQILYDVFGFDGSVASRDSDPSTWPTYDPNSPDTRTLGPLTVYKNRFGQTIAAEQSYQDLAWNGTVTNYTTSAAVQWDADGNETFYGEDAVSSITPESNALVVIPSNQGVVTNSSYNNQQLAEIKINDGGVEQSDVHNYGSQLQIEIGGNTYTFPNTSSASTTESDDSNTMAQPTTDIKRPGYVEGVAYGTSWFDSTAASLRGSTPSGDWGQPANSSFGNVKWSNSAHTVDILVGLLPPKGRFNCNTLMSSDISPNAGAYKLWAQNWTPGTQITVQIYVQITMILLANPSGLASGNINWTVYEGSSREVNYNDNIGVPPSTPLSNGIYDSVTDEFSVLVDVTTDSNGKANIVDIEPRMANDGPGTVIFFETIMWSPYVWPSSSINILTSDSKSIDSQIAFAPPLNIKPNIDANSILNSNSILEDKYLANPESDTKSVFRHRQYTNIDIINNTSQTIIRDNVCEYPSQDTDLVVSPPSWYHGLKIKLLEPLFVGLI